MSFYVFLYRFRSFVDILFPMKANEEYILKFWKRIDTLTNSKGVTLKELCQRAEINYGSMRRQRTLVIYPGVSELISIAKNLNTSLDYLLTGENTSTLSEEAQAVERDDKLRLLVNTLMHDPHLLEVVSTVNQSARHVDVKNTNKGA